MAAALIPDASLLTGLMAAQFLVHALGWGMTAVMQRHAVGVEAHFSVFWLAVTLALVTSMAPAVSAVSWHLASDLLLMLAPVAVHRGLLLFYHQPTPDALYLRLLGLTFLMALLAPWLPEGERLRLVWLHLGAVLGCVANALTLWRLGRLRTPLMARVVAVVLLMLAMALSMRLGGMIPIAVAARPLGHLAQGVGAIELLVVFFVAGLFNLVQIRLVLGRVMRRLLEQTRIDPLTGVSNRRGLMAALDGTHHRALRAGSAYALMIVDIDHFKRVNDEQGHAAGDAELHRVASQLAHTVRVGDSVGRLGGEEFCLLLPSTDRSGAERMAERVRIAVEQGTHVTVSVGVAMAQPSAESALDAMERADQALYRAKNEGRNRVVVADT